MEFIAILIREHQRISKELDEIGSLGNAGKSCLLVISEFEKILNIHIKKENETIYPKFNSSPFEEINKLGKMFSDQMKVYSIEIFDCLEAMKKAQGLMDNDLKQRFAKISERIKNRNTIEENILFPAYKKYFN